MFKTSVSMETEFLRKVFFVVVSLLDTFDFVLKKF